MDNLIVSYYTGASPLKFYMLLYCQLNTKVLLLTVVKWNTSGLPL